jgi:hypothetical protein
MTGDCIAYGIGRVAHENAKDYRFYQMAQPRIEKLIDKFGGFAIIISKYIYGIRAAMCVFYGIGKMPFLRFLVLDAISCFTWVLLLAGAGYFFSGAITSIIGDFRQIGVALFFLVLSAIIIFYVIERFWLKRGLEIRHSEIYRWFHDLSVELLLYLAARANREEVRRFTSLYMTHLRMVHCSLDGNALKAMGLPAGPEIGHIKEKLLIARLDGDITTDQEELELAQRLVLDSDRNAVITGKIQEDL